MKYKDVKRRRRPFVGVVAHLMVGCSKLAVLGFVDLLLSLRYGYSTSISLLQAIGNECVEPYDFVSTVYYSVPAGALVRSGSRVGFVVKLGMMVVF